MFTPLGFSGLLLGIPGYGGTSGPANTAPVIDLNGAGGGINASGTFTEGDAFTSYLSSATLTDADSDPLVSLIMTCGGADWGTDGLDEQIKFDTWVTDAATDKTETLVVGSTTFSLAFVSATGVLTVTKSGGGTFPAADGQALIRLFQYANAAEPPTEGDRTFSWVANDGTDNSTAAVLTLTVAVTAPSLTNPGTRYVALSQTINTISIPNAGSAGTWSVTSGTLPTGLSLNTSTGQITGTVDAGATVEVATIEVTCTNGTGSDAVTFDIDVRATVTTISSAETFPYYFDDGTTLYSFTENVTTSGTCGYVVASNVAIDLNGHDITFDNAAPVAVTNGGFETDANWTWTANITRFAGDYLAAIVNSSSGGNIFPDGSSYSAKVVVPSTDQEVVNDTAVSLIANERYVLHAHFKFEDFPAGFTAIVSGTATGGSTTTLVDTSRTEADDFWNDKWIRWTSGPNVGFVCRVTDFVQSTNTLTFVAGTSSGFSAVASGHTYDIVPVIELYAKLDNGTEQIEVVYDPQGKSSRGMQLTSQTFQAGYTDDYTLSIGVRNAAGSGTSFNCYIDDVHVSTYGRYGFAVGVLSFNLDSQPSTYWFGDHDETTFSSTNNDAGIVDSLGAGSVVQGQASSYRSACVWPLRATRFEAYGFSCAANGYQCRVISTKTDQSENVPSHWYHDLVLDGSATSAVESRDNHDDCCIGPNADGTFERITLAGTLHMGLRTQGVAVLHDIDVTGYVTKYTNGFSILCVNQDAGGEVFNNTIDLATSPREGMGLMCNTVSAPTDYTLVHDNTITARPPTRLQEYAGPQPFAYACQTERAKKIKWYDNTFWVKTSEGPASAFRVNPDASGAYFEDGHIHRNIFRGETEDDTVSAACMNLRTVNFSEFTVGTGSARNQFITNKCFFGQLDSVTNLTISDQSFRFIDDGFTAQPIITTGAATIVIDNPVYYDAGTRAAMDNYPVTTTAGTHNTSVTYTVQNDVVLRFVNGVTPQVGIGVVVTDEQEVEVFNGVSDANGEVTFSTKDFVYASGTRTSHKTHYIVTDVPSYHHADLDTAGQLEIIDVVADDEGPPPTPPTPPAIGTPQGNTLSAGTSFSVTTPGASGDTLIAYHATKVRTPNDMSGAGWTQLVQISNAIASGEKLTIWYKTHAGGSEPGSHTFGTNLSDNQAAIIVPITGGVSVGAWVQANTTTGATNPVTWPAVTAPSEATQVLRAAVDYTGKTASSTSPTQDHVMTQNIASVLTLFLYNLSEDAGDTGTVSLTKSGAGRSNLHTLGIDGV